MEIVIQYIQLHLPGTTKSELSRLLLGGLKKSIDSYSYFGLCMSIKKSYTAFSALDIRVSNLQDSNLWGRMLCKCKPLVGVSKVSYPNFLPLLIKTAFCCQTSLHSCCCFLPELLAEGSHLSHSYDCGYRSPEIDRDFTGRRHQWEVLKFLLSI